MAKLIGLVLVMAMALCVSVPSAFATDPTTYVDIYYKEGAGSEVYQSMQGNAYRRPEHLPLFQHEMQR